MGSACGSVNSDERRAELTSIWVPFCERGKGIGSKLFQAFVNEAKLRGADILVGQVLPENGQNYEDIYNFYEKNGATVDDDGILFIDLTTADLAEE